MNAETSNINEKIDSMYKTLPAMTSNSQSIKTPTANVILNPPSCTLMFLTI